MNKHLLSFLCILLVCTLYLGCSKNDPAINASGGNPPGTGGSGAEPPPQLGTISAPEIRRTVIYCTGTITGSSTTIIAKGFCAGTQPMPTLSNTSKVTIAGPTFTDSIKGLKYNTTYYIRSYYRTATDTTYSTQMTVTTRDAIVALKQEFQGGYVFYIDSTGEHGLIVAKSDIGRFRWQNCYSETGATAYLIGTGQANTALIVANVMANGSSCPTTGVVAAQACDNLVLNGYSDWFLPSANEFGTLRAYCISNASTINHQLSMDFYWTSSEVRYNTAYFAAGINAVSSSGYVYDKIDYWAVRPIRAF